MILRASLRRWNSLQYRTVCIEISDTCNKPEVNTVSEMLCRLVGDGLVPTKPMEQLSRNPAFCPRNDWQVHFTLEMGDRHFANTLDLPVGSKPETLKRALLDCRDVVVDNAI